MQDPKKQLTDQLVQLLERLFTYARPVGADEWTDLELTMPQLKTLWLLSQGPQRMSDIAGYLGVTLSSATSMIDRLVGKGLVERAHDPGDRRVVTCRLSPLGREHVERFWRVHHMKAEMLAKALSPQDLETVVKAMEIITAAVAGQGTAGAQSAPASGRGQGAGAGAPHPVEP